VDLDVIAFVERLDLDADGRTLWDAAAAHVDAAVHGEDAGLLAALEGSARSAALSGAVPVQALLDAYNEGCGQLCRHLEAEGGTRGRAACLRLRALDRAALSRVATGYCAGLEETVEALRREAADRSPVDPESGALKPRELVCRLALEAERSRRADGPLGLAAFGLAPSASQRGARPGIAREAGRRLSAVLRRYDSIGLTDAGDLVVIMPDVSRRGLVAATERLTQEAGRLRGPDAGVEVVCAFRHYDDADEEAAAMLAALQRGLDDARRARGRVAS
jgi:hypothetical protein